MEKNPRWMIWTGLVLLLFPLSRNLVFITNSFLVEQILIENTHVRMVAHVSTILGMLFLLPELRTRLAPLACLFLLTMLPLFSFEEARGSGNLGFALLVLIVGFGFMALSVGGSSRIYFIMGCLSSWLFAMSEHHPELTQKRTTLNMLLENVIHATFAILLGFMAWLIQKSLTQIVAWSRESEEPVNGS